MTALTQAIAGVMVAVILITVLRKQSQEIALLLSLAMCAMVLLIAGGYLKSVVSLIENLKTVAGLDDDLLSPALKAVGIALLSQFAGLICADSGNSAMGRCVELLGCAAILWLAMPLMNMLLELVMKITGEL